MKLLKMGEIIKDGDLCFNFAVRKFIKIRHESETWGDIYVGGIKPPHCEILRGGTEWKRTGEICGEN